MVAGLLTEIGFAVERHEVPPALAHAHRMSSVTNLVVRERFGDGPVIALNAHGDVVPPGDGWTKKPYGAEIVDGWMYGRGAAVSKSDFATYAWALLALKAAGSVRRGTVELHFSYDEESGGELGPAWLLAENISHPDYAIGAGFSYAVVNAHNGCLHLEVEVHGRSAHAAKPATGIDALEAATAILARLYAWRAGLAERASAVPGIGSAQMVVGLIGGGINTNVVPDRVTFRLDRRMIPEEQPDAVEAEMRALIADAANAHPEARVSVRRILLAEPLKPMPWGRRSERCAVRGGECGNGRTDRHQRRAALHRRPPLCGARRAHRSLRRRIPQTIEAANAHRADERLPLCGPLQGNRGHRARALAAVGRSVTMRTRQPGPHVCSAPKLRASQL